MSDIYGHILVPLDGSKLSRAALEGVAPLGQAAGSRITLMAVIEPVMMRAFEEYAQVEQISVYEAIQAYLDREAFEVNEQTELEVTGVTVAAEEMSPGARIARFAEDADAGMIAMSTHGRTGIARLFLGSVAKEVVETTTRPLLLFPSA